MYLYGASVQGIQDFIFKTNKLQEIVGASEIVKSIENDFLEIVKGFNVEIIMNAAGNVKALFEKRDECEKVILDFGKKIQQKAYGIGISQAVVKMEDDFQEEQNAINELERKLKIQRNKTTIPLDISLNIMELNPKTAKSLFTYDKRDEPLDRASKQKREAYNSWFKKQRVNKPNFKELKELSALSNDSKNKLAVIHADGNGLGELIPHLKKKANLSLSEFSKALDDATQEAFDLASQDIKKIKSIILGGDDLVVICDANDALKFTKDFLKYFEIQTQATVGVKLTACAGIAYSNEKYPFHYAVSLAEELCGVTKKHAKKLREKKKLDFVPSSLMFHNIQSSNFHSWDRFVEDELTIENDEYNGNARKYLDKKGGIRCDYGPYYLDESSQPLIQDFIHTVEAYRCDGSPISRLRAWIGELSKSSEYARLMLERINTMVEQKGEWHSCIMEKNLKALDKEIGNDKLIVLKDDVLDKNNNPIILKDGKNKKYYKTPIYDVLQILSATEAK